MVKLISEAVRVFAVVADSDLRRQLEQFLYLKTFFVERLETAGV